MIELSNKKDKNNRPSFNSDLKRLTELIKDDQFILEVTKKIFDFYEENLDKLENQSIFGFAYWNRFTGDIVVKMATDLYEIRTNLPFDNDLLSYFTVVSFNDFELKKWLKNKLDSNQSEFLSLASESLKAKINSQFESWYLDLFEAISENSLMPLDYYYAEFRVTPIDFLSEDEQLENYWFHLEPFSSEYLKENGHYPSIYQSVLPEEVYKEAKKQNLIVEVFPSMSILPLDEDPIVYSPVRSDLAVITSESYSVDFDLKSLEEQLVKTGSKTTKDVQNTIKLILQINNFRLSDELKSHLNFVLSMETID